MSIDTIAVLRIPYVELCQSRGLEPASSHEHALKATFPFTPVGTDGTAVFLGVKFGTEPRELASVVRIALGATLERHDDERGVLMVPDVGWQDQGYESYAAALDHFGEAGEWVQKVTAEEAQTMTADRIKGMVGGNLADELAAVQSELGDSLLGDPSAMQAQLGAVKELFENNPDAAKAATEAVQEQLGGLTSSASAEGGAGNLMDMAQQMLSRMTPDQQSQLEQMAQAMFGGGAKPSDPSSDDE